MHRSHPRLLRLSATLLATTLLVIVGAVPATAAPAKKKRVKITAPTAGATVGNAFRIKARVRPYKRTHTISYYVDGKLVARRRHKTRSSRSAGISRSASVRAPRLSAGRHTVRVVMRAGRNRASGQVRVKVRKKAARRVATAPASTPTPAAPAAPAAAASAAPAETTDLNHIAPTIPDNQTVPTTNADGFSLIFAEDFNKPAAKGTWASDCDAGKIVYTGETGTRWRTYPKCYLDTRLRRPYRSDEVLSVHHGVLDFHLRNVDGQPAGANPSPVINGDSQYQTFGRYEARLKIVGDDLSEYYMAWLLWPYNEAAWDSAESDFPELALRPGPQRITGWHHSSAGQEPVGTPGKIDMREWHTYTQDWTPLERRYYVDGRLIGITVNPVYQAPQRWQLQTETIGHGTNEGHLLVDWVAVYSWAPGVSGS